MSEKLQGGLLVGSESVRVPVILRSTTDNTGVTGKDHTDITASYLREGGVRVAITPADLSSDVDAAYSSGGFVEVDATNMPGSYVFHVPNAAFVAGADWVAIAIKVSGAYMFYREYALTVTYAVPGSEMDLVADAITAAKFDQLTAHPMANANGSDLTEVGGDGAQLTTCATATGFSLASVAGALADVAAAGEVTEADTMMQYLKQILNVLEGAPGISAIKTAAAPANGVSISEMIRAIYDDSNNLQTSQGDWATATGFAVAGDAMTLEADAIKKVSYDESTAYPLLSADTGASKVARTGADSDTLETLSDEIATRASTTELNKVPKSDGTSSWNATALAAIEGEVDNALDNAISSPTADSLLDYILRLKKTIINQMEITEASGNTVIRDDNDVDPFATKNGAFTSDATTTTRLRLET